MLPTKIQEHSRSLISNQVNYSVKSLRLKARWTHQPLVVAITVHNHQPKRPVLSKDLQHHFPSKTFLHQKRILILTLTSYLIYHRVGLYLYIAGPLLVFQARRAAGLCENILNQYRVKIFRTRNSKCLPTLSMVWEKQVTLST